MAVKPIPEGYHTITPYLVVDKATEFIDFLVRAFKATEVSRHSRPDGSVAHAEIKIGNSIIMLSDSMESFPANRVMLYMYVEDTDALYNSLLSFGAESIQEPMNLYYGDRNAGVRDKWGNMWWIATHIEDVPEEELQRRIEDNMKQKA